MRWTLLALPLIALASAAAADLPPFANAAETYRDAAACRNHLEQVVDEARSGDFDAVEGPYALTAGDVRAHTVRSDGLGHRVSEYRCEGAQLSTRSWVERLDRRAEGPYSIESLAGAHWLEQSSRQ